MASKIDRLLFIRKRLATDIKHQVEIISTLQNDTVLGVTISRKEALEDLWTEFKQNQEIIETTRDWIGDDDFITESTQLHDAYVSALIKLLTLLPEETEGLQQSLNAFRQSRRNQSVYHEEIPDSPGETNDNNDADINNLSTSTSVPTAMG